MTVAFAATYYRTALLLGLVRGETVHQWAEQMIANDPNPPSAIFEVVSAAPGDLSGLRYALWPMTIEPDPPPVIAALLGLLSRDLDAGQRTMADTLAVVRQIRSMVKLPAAIYAGLNAALVEQAGHDASPSPLAEWLRPFADAAIPDRSPF